jgi:large conductance mechanosensitive channel
MKIAKEFKEFAVKGNVVDMAVGVIIGTAFGKIVSSFVADVITPPLGILIGGVDFRNLTIILRDAPDVKNAVVLKYGLFLQATFDFFIVAAAIFAVVKLINRLKKEPLPASAKPLEPTKEEQLLTEIRDALRAQNKG